MPCSAICAICLETKAFPEQLSFFVACGATSDADLKVIDALGQLRPGTSDMDVVATQLRYLGSHPRLHSDTKARMSRALDMIENEMGPTAAALQKEKAGNAILQNDVVHLLADNKRLHVEAAAATRALESERSRTRAMEDEYDKTKLQCARMKQERDQAKQERDRTRAELDRMKQERDQREKDRNQTKQERVELFKENLDAQKMLTAMLSERQAVKRERHAMEKHRGRQMANLDSDLRELDLVSELAQDLNESRDRETDYIEHIRALQGENLSLYRKLKEQARKMASLVLEHAEQVARVAPTARNEAGRRGGTGDLQGRHHAAARQHRAAKTGVAFLPLSVKPSLL
ncbi:hypothetical protein GGG16DRAFT_123467 [Schizophyllum commune]